MFVLGREQLRNSHGLLLFHFAASLYAVVDSKMEAYEIAFLSRPDHGVGELFLQMQR
jgi:hypothetical protein